MSDFDSTRFERARQFPDEHRFPEDATSSGRPQRAGLKIAIGLAVAIVVAFVAMAVFDDGSSNNPPEGSAITFALDR